MNQSAAQTLPAPAITLGSASDKWQQEYDAFVRLKSQLLATYAGSYVVIHNGQVVDSGPDEVALALRFFAQHGNIPVHIGLAAEAPESLARIPHYREQPRGS